ARLLAGVADRHLGTGVTRRTARGSDRAADLGTAVARRGARAALPPELPRGGGHGVGGWLRPDPGRLRYPPRPDTRLPRGERRPVGLLHPRPRAGPRHAARRARDRVDLGLRARLRGDAPDPRLAVHRRRLTMRLAGLAVAALVLLLVPSAAQAGSVDHQPGSSQLSFTGTGAETNTTTITLSGGVLSVSDATSGMGQPAGSNCTQTGPGSFDCPAAGVTRISVSLGGGDDTMTLNASTPSTLNGDDGNDAITGGSGPDTIDGGKGNDTIDGGAGDDVVSGGPGPQGGASDADKFTGGSGSDTI